MVTKMFWNGYLGDEKKYIAITTTIKIKKNPPAAVINILLDNKFIGYKLNLHVREYYFEFSVLYRYLLLY